MQRLPSLTALRAFEAAARLGSFVKAGDELAVTPAAISQQVRSLEEELGVELFRRLSRGLVLTEAGRGCLPDLGRGFAHLARAVETTRAGSLEGPLVVSAIPSFAFRWLMPRLPPFCAAYPMVDLTVRTEMRNVDFVRESVDLGLRYGAGRYPGLDAALLLEEEIYPVCAPSVLSGPHPLRRIADLRRHTLLHDRQVDAKEPTSSWERWLRRAGLDDVDPSRGPGFTDSTMLTEACLRGMGVMLGRSALVADDLAAGRLVRPLDLSAPAEFAYYLVTPPGHGGNPRVRLMLDWLREQAAR